jgi:hypothetical protein
MKKELMNLFLFIGICFISYLIFKNLHFNTVEGMTNSDTPTPTNDGIAGNAAAYGATIKAATIKLQDTFLISKYRTDYETSILNLDDLLNNLMLKTALSIDSNNPGDSIKQLSDMNQAKLALNNVMKYVDKQ